MKHFSSPSSFSCLPRTRFVWQENCGYTPDPVDTCETEAACTETPEQQMHDMNVRVQNMSRLGAKMLLASDTYKGMEPHGEKYDNAKRIALKERIKSPVFKEVEASITQQTKDARNLGFSSDTSPGAYVRNGGETVIDYDHNEALPASLQGVAEWYNEEAQVVVEQARDDNGNTHIHIQKIWSVNNNYQQLGGDNSEMPKIQSLMSIAVFPEGIWVTTADRIVGKGNKKALNAVVEKLGMQDKINMQEGGSENSTYTVNAETEIIRDTEKAEAYLQQVVGKRMDITKEVFEKEAKKRTDQEEVNLQNMLDYGYEEGSQDTDTQIG